MKKLFVLGLILLAIVLVAYSPMAQGATVPSSGYDDFIYYDYYVGTAGTAYPMGTKQAPIVNITDLKTVCLATNIKRIHVKGPLTLSSSFDNFVFVGDSPQDAVVNLNNQSTNFSSFHKLVLRGNQLFASNDIYVHDSVVVATQLAATIWNSCIGGPTSLRNNPGDVTYFFNCFTGTALPSGTSNISTYGSNACFRNWTGPLTVMNMNNSGAVVDISGQNNSPVTLHSSNTAGTIMLYGKLIVTNNVTGTTVVQNYAY